jgi:hypothetical protein
MNELNASCSCVVSILRVSYVVKLRSVRSGGGIIIKPLGVINFIHPRSVGHHHHDEKALGDQETTRSDLEQLSPGQVIIQGGH